MRAAGNLLLVLLVTAVATSSTGSASGEVSGLCAARPSTASVWLPAPITIRTSCGAFRFGRDGGVRRTSTNPSPVPQGVGWWPYTGVWDKLESGHLVVGRWQRRLWRSSGRFPVAYEVSAIMVGPHALAFSYGNRVQQLYLARLGGRERPIARGEFPLGWTSGELYTRRGRGGELLLRGETGAIRSLLVRHVSTYAYDQASGSLYFLAHGTVIRAHGADEYRLASLARLGLSPGPALQLQPLGRLVALRDAHRLVVLRADGSTFAATPLPRVRERADSVSSPLSAAPDATAVAFTATRGNTAYGSSGSETVYLLRPGVRSAQAVHSERVHFAVCERGADLAWHGRWLLYSASEGNLAAINTGHLPGASELSRLVRSLPGASGDQGNLNFSAYWSGHPTGI